MRLLSCVEGVINNLLSFDIKENMQNKKPCVETTFNIVEKISKLKATFILSVQLLTPIMLIQFLCLMIPLSLSFNCTHSRFTSFSGNVGRKKFNLNTDSGH